MISICPTYSTRSIQSSSEPEVLSFTGVFTLRYCLVGCGEGTAGPGQGGLVDKINYDGGEGHNDKMNNDDGEGNTDKMNNDDGEEHTDDGEGHTDKMNNDDGEGHTDE